jgi:hypothetical protein
MLLLFITKAVVVFVVAARAVVALPGCVPANGS